MESAKKDNLFDAQKYLDKHGIEKLVGDMLNSLLHEKDEHPKIYMIKYLAGQLTKEELEQNKLVIPEPYPKTYISKKKKHKKEESKQEISQEEAKNEIKGKQYMNNQEEQEAKLEEDQPKKEEEEFKVSVNPE